MNARLLFILLLMGACSGGIAGLQGGEANRLNAAEAALGGGSPRVALQIAAEVLRDDPDNVRAPVIQGDALASLGQPDAAAASYQRALRLDPGSRDARIGLGRLRLGTDLAAAERLFQEMSREDPRDPVALNNLGIAHDLQRRHQEAQAAYRQSLTINPDQQAARVNLALSLAMSGQGSTAIALVEPMATAPDAPRKLRHNHAAVLALAGRRSDAERILGADLPPAEVRQALAALEDFRNRPALMVSTRTDAAAARGLPAARAAAESVTASVAEAKPVNTGVAEGERVAAGVAAPVTATGPAPMAGSVTAPVTPPVAAAEATPFVAAVPTPAAVGAPAAAPYAETGAGASTAGMAETRPVPAPAGGTDGSRMAATAGRDPASPTQAPPAPPEGAGSRGGRTTVQLGALPSEDAARAAWDKLSRGQPALLAGHEPVIIKAEVNGKTYWRLRTAGFADAAEARAFCGRVRATGAVCIIAAF